MAFEANSILLMSDFMALQSKFLITVLTRVALQFDVGQDVIFELTDFFECLGAIWVLAYDGLLVSLGHWVEIYCNLKRAHLILHFHLQSRLARQPHVIFAY